MDWDEAIRPGNIKIAVGDNLERASIGDLEARIGSLKAEIERVEAEIDRKKKVGADAAAVFKS